MTREDPYRVEGYKYQTFTYLDDDGISRRYGDVKYCHFESTSMSQSELEELIESCDVDYLFYPSVTKIYRHLFLGESGTLYFEEQFMDLFKFKMMIIMIHTIFSVFLLFIYLFLIFCGTEKNKTKTKTTYIKANQIPSMDTKSGSPDIVDHGQSISRLDKVGSRCISKGIRITPALEPHQNIHPFYRLSFDNNNLSQALSKKFWEVFASTSSVHHESVLFMTHSKKNKSFSSTVSRIVPYLIFFLFFLFFFALLVLTFVVDVLPLFKSDPFYFFFCLLLMNYLGIIFSDGILFDLLYFLFGYRKIDHLLLVTNTRIVVTRFDDFLNPYILYLFYEDDIHSILIDDEGGLEIEIIGKGKDEEEEVTMNLKVVSDHEKIVETVRSAKEERESMFEELFSSSSESETSDEMLETTESSSLD